MQRHVGLPRPPYGEVDDLLFCWEAHRIALGGCDMLLLANASNRFAAFACMQPGEWRDWERSAVLALRASLAACGFAEGSIDAYLFFGGIPVVTRTHGRRPVAFMNVLVDKLLPLALRGYRPAGRALRGRPRASGNRAGAIGVPCCRASSP